MKIRERDSFPRAPEGSSYALGIVTAIAVAAGFAMVAAWFALLVPDERPLGPANRGAPQWMRGDRVKVIKGRVETVSSPAERTPIPNLPVAQAP
jgi:hypothetical protein